MAQQQSWLPEQVKELLRDSSWVTIAWDWFQTFLGRAVEAVLWATMVLSCYQLIPGVKQPTPEVSSLGFILQFIALDVGGLGLNTLAQQQGLSYRSYARIIAFVLIGITLITVTVAGVEHAVQVDSQVKAWIEVLLVIARAVMTVLYGPAIRSLKEQDRSMQDHIAELEYTVSSLRRHLESEQRTVSSLRVQVSEKQQAVDTLTGQVDTLTGQLEGGQASVSRWKQQADAGQGEVSSLRSQLVYAQAESEGLRAQLSVKQRELEALRTALDSEQGTVSRLRAMLDSQQERLFSYSQRVESGQTRPGQAHPGQTASKRVSSVQGSSSGQQGGQVDSGQVIDLDATRIKRKSGAEEGAERALLEQIRGLLQQEPGLSGRAIAKKLSCSPTTAAKWKEFLEREQQQASGEV